MQALVQIMLGFFAQTNDEFVKALDAHNQFGYEFGFAHHFRFVGFAERSLSGCLGSGGCLIVVSNAAAIFGRTEYVLLDVRDDFVDFQR